jgi:hypothetical protein
MAEWWQEEGSAAAGSPNGSTGRGRTRAVRRDLVGGGGGPGHEGAANGWQQCVREMREERRRRR